MYTKLKISEAKNLVKEKLEKDMLQLPEIERVVVEFPISVEGYKLNHPRGALLIVYKGADYKPTKLESFILQDRDMQIGVIAVIKKRSGGGMDPEDYVDFVNDCLTGVEIQVDRQDNKMYPLPEEWIKEEAGEWWYGSTFILPALNVEKEILENQ